MLLEWLRRNIPDLDARLRPRLFTEGSIAAPLSERAWKVLDEAVARTARHVLAARPWVCPISCARRRSLCVLRRPDRPGLSWLEGGAAPPRARLVEAREPPSRSHESNRDCSTRRASRVLTKAVLPPANYYAYHQAIANGGYPASRQVERLVAAVHSGPQGRRRRLLHARRGLHPHRRRRSGSRLSPARPRGGPSHVRRDRGRQDARARGGLHPGRVTVLACARDRARGARGAPRRRPGAGGPGRGRALGNVVSLG